MRQKGNKGRVKKEKYSPLLHQDHDSNAYAATREGETGKSNDLCSS